MPYYQQLNNQTKEEVLTMEKHPQALDEATQPIDVKKLEKVLYKTFCTNNNDNEVPRLFRHISQNAEILKADVEKGSPENFLKQLRTFFWRRGNPQAQLSLVLFIKDFFIGAELEKFIAQIMAAPRRVLTPKMKSAITAQLQ